MTIITAVTTITATPTTFQVFESLELDPANLFVAALVFEGVGVAVFEIDDAECAADVETAVVVECEVDVLVLELVVLVVNSPPMPLLPEMAVVSGSE